ncbi:MAG: phosphoribosylformimino-5-aminoimidazole carboxamide ribotide isomerase [Lachnospiraceae bacterium]|nr:phosphoribosylformimino-5-aminoimidazole carboxamide ribotide isomerase [Lachnospiraceae bacterium]
MEFRPCIDIHNGKVKQIVGSSLKDEGNLAQENFVSEKSSAYYANLYRENGLKGGHIILLNKMGSEYYEATKQAAVDALQAFSGGMQVGGGIHAGNAKEYLDAGASHVIVTSYLFDGDILSREKMQTLKDAVGREHVVFDLSCRKTAEGYQIMTNRWQTATSEYVTIELLKELEQYCDEFLIHAVDVEGKAEGIEKELVALLGIYEGNAVTYAGGIHAIEDLALLKELGNGRVHATIGSALDLFGGYLHFDEIVKFCNG